MFLAILHHYLIWHYSRAYFEFFRIWTNLLWFVVHYFSMKQLLFSWFSPWKRVTEQRTKAWDIEDMASSILINLLSRIVGAMLRTIVLVVGLAALSVLLIGGLVVYATWFLAPVLLVTLIVMGVIYIVT